MKDATTNSSPKYAYHNTKKVSANEGCFATKHNSQTVYLKTFFAKKEKGKPLELNYGSGIAEVLASHLRIYLDEEVFGVKKGKSRVVPYYFVRNNEDELRIESTVLGGIPKKKDIETSKNPLERESAKPEEAGTPANNSKLENQEQEDSKKFVPLWKLAGFKAKPRGIFHKDLYQSKIKNLMGKLSPKEKDDLSQDLVTNLWFANRDPNLGNVGRYKGSLWFLDQGHSLRGTDGNLDKINKEYRGEVLKAKPINNLRLYGVNKYEIFRSDASKDRANKIESMLKDENKCENLSKEIRKILREKCLSELATTEDEKIKCLKEFAKFSGCDLNKSDKTDVKQHFQGKEKYSEDKAEFWIQLIGMQLTNNLEKRGKQLAENLRELEAAQLAKQDKTILKAMEFFSSRFSRVREIASPSCYSGKPAPGNLDKRTRIDRA